MVKSFSHLCMYFLFPYHDASAGVFVWVYCPGMSARFSWSLSQNTRHLLHLLNSWSTQHHHNPRTFPGIVLLLTGRWQQQQLRWIRYQSWWVGVEVEFWNKEINCFFHKRHEWSQLGLRLLCFNIILSQGQLKVGLPHFVIRFKCICSSNDYAGSLTFVECYGCYGGTFKLIK